MCATSNPNAVLCVRMNSEFTARHVDLLLSWATGGADDEPGLYRALEFVH